MRLRIRLAIAVTTISATVVAAPIARADASAPVFEMVGWAGGSIVRAANGTVTSALTVASSVEGPQLQADTNNAASTRVAKLLVSGSVSTSTEAVAVPGGVEVLSHVATTGLSMFGGAIRAKAVYTTATAVYADGVVKSDAWSTFVGLHIVGHKLPANIPANFQITIPNVAAVQLNARYTVASPGSTAMAEGAGLFAILLAPRGHNAVGANVMVNPSYAADQLVNPTVSHQVGGTAYGTAIYGPAGQITTVKADPTAMITLPGGGTSGVTDYNTIAAGDLAPSLQIGAVTDSATGTSTATVLDSRLTSQIAGLNLFNGMIRVDAILATAHAHGAIDATGNLVTPSTDGTATLVNLYIGGKKISLATRPNTVINVLDFGSVTIDQQVATPLGILVRALDIKLSTAQPGLPVGTELQIGTAIASVQ